IAYAMGAASFLDMIEATTTCRNMPTMADRMHWRADSVVSPGADYDYPQTPTSFWYCGNQPNETTGLGYFYNNRVNSQKDVHCVGGMCTGEDVYADPPTVTAMLNQLVGSCTARH